MENCSGSGFHTAGLNEALAKSGKVLKHILFIKENH